jgi:hypothetical protein
VTPDRRGTSPSISPPPIPASTQLPAVRQRPAPSTPGLRTPGVPPPLLWAVALEPAGALFSITAGSGGKKVTSDSFACSVRVICEEFPQVDLLLLTDCFVMLSSSGICLPLDFRHHASHSMFNHNPTSPVCVELTELQIAIA